MKQQLAHTETSCHVALWAARPELATQLRSWIEGASPFSCQVTLLDAENFTAAAACDVAVFVGNAEWVETSLSQVFSVLPIVVVVEGNGGLQPGTRAKIADELALKTCSAPLLQRALRLVLAQSASAPNENAPGENTQGLQDVLIAADELLQCESFNALLRRAVELGVERLHLENCALYLVENNRVRGTFTAAKTADSAEPVIQQNVFAAEQGAEWVKAATPRGHERWVVRQIDSVQDETLVRDEMASEAGAIVETRFSPDVPSVEASAAKKAAVWRAATLIRAAGGVIGIWHNDTRVSGRDVERAQQELVAVYCSLLGNIIEHKRADTALRESERRFRLLTEHATDLIVRMTPKGRILYVSPSCRRTLGFEPEEFTGHSVREWVHPDDMDEAFLFQRHPETLPDIYRRELRVRRCDGTYGWFEAVSRPVLDGLGRAREYQTTAREISSRRQMEDALRQSEERFRAFMDNTPTMTFIKDPDGRYLYFNRTAEQLHGVRLEEIKGNTNFDRMPLEVARQLRDNDRQVLATGQSHEFMEILPDKNGHDRYWLTFKFPLRGPDGRTDIGGVAVDVTERREFEAALGRSEQRLSTVVDSASLVLWAIDHEGIFTLSQGQGLKLLGLTPGQVVGQSCFEVYRDFPDVCAHLRRALGGESFSSDVSIGQTVFQVRFNPLHDEEGATVGALGVAFDITERRRSEETLAVYAARLENVLEIDRAIRAAQSSATIAEVALKQLCRYLPCERTCVAVFDFEAGTARVLATLGENCSYHAGHVYPLDEFLSETSPDEYEEADTLRRTLPLLAHNERVGALRLELNAEEKATTMLGEAVPLSERWTMAHEVAGQLAIAIQQARLLEQVRAGKAQLQTLSHSLIQAQESERRRLAHELHDEIGQVLTAVKLNLQNIARQLESRPDGENRRAAPAEPIDQQLKQSTEIVEGALQNVRDMSLNLRPSLLDDLGLAAALRWYVDRMTSTLPVRAQLKVELPPKRPAPEIETSCFRIAQEALTNAIRHARAHEILITVRVISLPATCPHPPGMAEEPCDEFYEIELVISDDGRGFDVHHVRAHAAGSSLGLPGMEERAALVDGRFMIESAPGQGTRVSAYFPL